MNKTCFRFRIMTEFQRKKFKGYLSPQAGVLSPVDHTHTTTTQFFHNPVMGNDLSDHDITPIRS
jgi:hypothetical protein